MLFVYSVVAMGDVLKQKDKDITKLAEKLKQCELALGRQKILLKDRKNFQRFCKFLGLQDVDLAFESAAAKEQAVDIEELQSAATPLRDSVSTIREFSELVLGHSVTEISALRTLWLRRSDSDRVDDSLSINMVVHDQIRLQAERIEKLENELRRIKVAVHREESSCQTETRKAGTTLPTQTDKIDTCVGHVSESVVKALELDSKKTKEKYMHELELVQRDEKKLRDENLQLQSAVHALENERDKYGFIEDIASRQAERDSEISRLRHELSEVRLQKGFASEDLEERKILLKNIFIKFVGYAMLDDLDKMKSLVPIAREVFDLTDRDVEELESICQGTSFLNSFVAGWTSSSQARN